jgi:serine/threonine protein kinase
MRRRRTAWSGPGRAYASTSFSASSAAAPRFLTEARATARCNHENIVVIHEVGSHEGQPFMVLEYLDGSTLAKVLSDSGDRGDPSTGVPPHG